MQKPPNYCPNPLLNINNPILEDPQHPMIPGWHKIIVAERLRNRNKPNNLDIPWDEIIQRLKDQHENL
ncbi:hypothetical protein [Aquirufa sp. 5-AUSEE-100C1]